MVFNLKRPCRDCPFRQDRYFHLNKNRKKEIAEDLLEKDKTFACHNTTNGEYDEELEYEWTGEESHCAGALIVMQKERSLFNNFMLRLATRAKIFDPAQLDLGSSTYNSMQEFIEATHDPK